MGVSFPDRAGARSTAVWFEADRASLVGACAVIVLLASAVIDPNVAWAALTVAVLVPAAVIDVRERRLPDRIVGAAAIVLSVAIAVGWIAGAEIDLFGIAVGAIAVGGPLLVLHLASPDAMGFGDVKLAAVLGAAIGTIDWQLGLLALTLAAGAGAAVGIARRSRTIAFGPFLVAGAVAVLFIAAVIPAPFVTMSLFSGATL